MITDNSRTQISEPSPNKIEQRNNSKDQIVLEKSLKELEVHSDGGSSQERIDDDNQFSDELRGC